MVLVFTFLSPFCSISLVLAPLTLGPRVLLAQSKPGLVLTNLQSTLVKIV